jgi:hypothetical protein
VTRHRSHQWSTVVDRFRELGVVTPRFASLADAVARVAQSRHAARLYPVKSLHTLVLYQNDHTGPRDAQLRLDADGSDFVVRYLPSAIPDPRLALTPVHGTWTTRGIDALVLLDRAFNHLRWFAEPAPSAGAKVSERSPGR